MLLEVAPVLESFQIENRDSKRVLWEVIFLPTRNETTKEAFVGAIRQRAPSSEAGLRQDDVALAGLLLARAPLLQTMAFFRGFVHSPPDWITRYVEDPRWLEHRAAICHNSSA
uniref:Uncharacterized protein n=1 Tax=Oryza punctata TaxID=4537 RepID=A0A0E0LM32_ORYPU